MNDEDNRRGKWVDGYWNGSLVDGYPASYFDSTCLNAKNILIFEKVKV